MDIQTNIIEEYVNYVDNIKKKKQNCGYVQLYCLYLYL